MKMMNEKELLDRQLSCVTWTQRDRQAVRCAIRKERTYPMKKKMMLILTAALLLMTLTGAAFAACFVWGVKDFAQRDQDVSALVLDSPVQTEIPQQGGMGKEACFSVTDAVWDGETVCITLLAQPNAPSVLLMDSCLSPDMTVQNLDRELSVSQSIGEWAVDNGFTDMLGLDISPSLNGDWPASMSSWHMEENGAMTMLIVFEGLKDNDVLPLTFLCSTFGYDPETDSFSDLSRSDSVTLTCTLSAPDPE